MHDNNASEGDVNSTPGRRRWQAKQEASTRRLLARDEQAFLHQSLSTPCLDVLETAADAHLIDVAGRRILDFHGNSVHQVGYGHPRVIEAVKAELDALPFSPRRYTNRSAITLAERLGALAPGDLDKLLFAPSGAAAIGIALKLARHATGRHKTLSMWDAFHGANLDALSVGGEALFRRDAGPLLPGSEHLPPLDLATRFFGDDGQAFERLADYIDYVLEVQGDVAALVAEPIRWTRVQAPPADFWPRVRASCDRHGTLLVFDEIPSCLGRTGTMFVCEQFNTTPDLLVIGKGLGGGIMPMAAVIARTDLDTAGDRALGHYTHEKSSVGSAAALATLDVIEAEGLLERARELGASTLQRLQGMAACNPALADARGLGMHWGVDVAAVGAHAAHSVADEVMYACLEQGLSFKIGGGHVATLSPPLTIQPDDLEHALTVFDSAARQVAERLATSD